MGTPAFAPLNPLFLHPDVRDYPGLISGPVIRRLELLARSGCCYVPRVYKCPASVNETMAAGAYTSNVLSLKPGSFIYGLKSDLGFPYHEIQVTDLALNRQWYQAPQPNPMFCTYNTLAGTAGPVNMPFLLAEPYPVIEPGTFQFEFWRSAAAPATAIINLLVYVAEVRD